MLEHKTIFSEDWLYRFSLWREVAPLPGFVQFIGLNPSTADETLDDPTIRRCKDFTRRWGYGALCMTNLFAYRATLPAAMKSYINPIGMRNTDWILTVAREAALTICAWGRDGLFLDRQTEVVAALRADGVLLCHLGLNKDKTPKHPLYLRADTQPILWD